MTDFQNLIMGWAVERGLADGDPTKQMLKLMEEVGELAHALARGDDLKMVDAIGDIYVVLTILGLQKKVSMQYCINVAWEQIKNRKGKTVNGVFIKEEKK